MKTWLGDINNLVLEGRSFQNHFQKVAPCMIDEKNLIVPFPI